MFKPMVEKIVHEKSKGQFAAMTWGKELKVSAKVQRTLTEPVKIEKISKATVRFGVEYDHIGDVKEARANGELPSENQGLPWGMWTEYPYFIGHNGNDYLRVSTVNGQYTKTQYFKNGEEISKDEAMKYCNKSEFPENSDKPIEVLTLNVENIQEIK